jgi:hypothetical protein
MLIREPSPVSYILLYPLLKNEKMIDEYHFIDTIGNKRSLKIKTIDLMECLKWKQFINDFPHALV